MANLTIRISTTHEEFNATDLDFSTVTPLQIIDKMRGEIPEAGQGMGWTMLRDKTVVDQNVTLDKLGFKDGDTAILTGKVEGA